MKANTDERRRSGAPRPTILVVDDEDAIRDFLRSALEAEGYVVLAAGDGEDALSLCDRYHVDVILLDLMMPRLDGLGFLQRFRHRFGPGGVSVYIMSAVRTAVEHASAAGIAGAFLKPFDLEELLETIASEVRQRRAPQHGDGSSPPLRYAGPA